MRVFQQYYFDLKDRVLFKDTLPFVEAWLAGQGIAYDGMMLAMHFTNIEEDRDTPRVIARFPGLEKYCRVKVDIYKPPSAQAFLPHLGRTYSSDFTSVPENWPEDMNIHVAKEDEDTIRQIAAKIPRPFNPSATCIALDNVRWFPEINTCPAYILGRGAPCGYSLFPHLSNSIALGKSSSSGKKHNVIAVSIERTHTLEQLLDDTAILEKMTAAFETAPHYRALRIVFSEEEHRQTQATDEALTPILEDLWAELKPESAVPKDVPPEYQCIRRQNEGEPDLMLIYMPGEPVSPKKAILKAVKGMGFQYKYGPGGYYECWKINQYNHKFKVWFAIKPMTRQLNFGAGISGYNFHVSIPMAHQVDVMKQSVADETAQMAVAAALQAQARLSDTLLRLYGKTPDWYWHSGDPRGKRGLRA